MTRAPLPKPKLGDVTAITLTSPDLDRSLAFYQKLGFRELFRSDFPFPFIQITDGALLMMLRAGKDPYCALTFYTPDPDKVAAELEGEGIKFLEKPKAGDFIKRYLMQSPDGLNITLVTWAEGFAKPAGPTMLTMEQQDYFNPAKYVNQTCGMYGEFAHPVKSLEESLAFWSKLGFTAISKFASPYPWAIISDGLAVVGLHETTQFKQPAITFFAADMKDKIEKLKQAGIADYTEAGPANIILNTPENQKINLFKLGM